MDKDNKEALRYVEGFHAGSGTVVTVMAKLILKYMALGHISVVEATHLINWCKAELKKETENA